MRVALEAALAWWTAREPRERLLLAILGLLVAALVYVYGLYQPLQHWADAEAERQAGVSAALVQARTLDAAIRGRRNASRGTIDAATLQRTAAEAGVVIGTPEASASGGIAVGVESAPAKPLFAWLASLHAEHGAGVRSFEAHVADDGGGVQARIVFAGRAR